MVIKLGEMLIKKNIINEGQLKEALSNQEKNGERIGMNLLKINAIDKKNLLGILSEQLGVERVDLEDVVIERKVIERVPARVAMQHKILPVRVKGSTLLFATAEPLNMWIADKMQKLTGYECDSILALESDIDKAIRKYYKGE